MNQFEEMGRRENPTLVCVPGLLGGPENFTAMVPAFLERFHILIFDPNRERRNNGGISGLTAQVMKELSYNSTASDIADTLKEIGKREAFFMGVSLGGKIVYDFALKYPDVFAGGVVTDVGPMPFEETELYRFINTLVASVDLTLPWPQLKEQLNKIVPDRSLRIMLQSQISYPDGKPPGTWKTGMRYLSEMLERQQIGDQFEGLMKVDAFLAREGRHINVFKASCLTGISDDCLVRMRDLKSVRIFPLEGASHFVHVSHKNAIVEIVNAMPEVFSAAKMNQKMATC